MIKPIQYAEMLARINRVSRDVQELSQPVERERDLHNQISEVCRGRGWIALHGSMAAATHRTMGEPDYVILADSCRVFLVEAKSRIGKLSPAQQAFKAQAARLGHTVHVVRSLEAFLEVVK